MPTLPFDAPPGPRPLPFDAPTTRPSWDAALRLPVVQTTRRCDIYEADGLTPYLLNVGIEGGSVSVDATREERRSMDAELFSTNPLLRHYPGGLWYDKIVKLYRGTIADDLVFEIQVGEFMLDTIKQRNFPGGVALSGRDYTTKLITAKFGQATTFAAGQAPEQIIKTIATNGGITRFRITATGKTTGKDFAFDRGTTRWAAIAGTPGGGSDSIATAYGLEVYFDAMGYLVVREMRDPVTSPLSYTFRTGVDGQVGTYEKSTSSARIYNHIAVTGEAAGQTTVFAEAFNTEPSSPTNTTRMGIRTYEMVSAFITTTEQAQDVASKHLKLHALEQFELDLETLCIPWLEGNDIMGWVDPDPAPGDPTRFLLSSFSIPMTLDLMSLNARRVTSVG